MLYTHNLFFCTRLMHTCYNGIYLDNQSIYFIDYLFSIIWLRFHFFLLDFMINNADNMYNVQVVQRWIYLGNEYHFVFFFSNFHIKHVSTGYFIIYKFNSLNEMYVCLRQFLFISMTKIKPSSVESITLNISYFL